MKLVTAVVKPFKLDEVKDAVKAVGVTGHDRRSGRGFGRTGGHIEDLPGQGVQVRLRRQDPASKIICTDELVDELIDAIVSAARTDTVGDGVAWVTDVEHVVRIRTNERGPAAL